MGKHGRQWNRPGIPWVCPPVNSFETVIFPARRAFTGGVPGKRRPGANGGRDQQSRGSGPKFASEAANRGRIGKFRTRRPVSRVLSPGASRRTVGRPFIWDGRCRPPRATYPKDSAKTHPQPEAAGPSYSVLLPVGFTLPPPSPGARCALTAPFHPCLIRESGGLLSVALSLGSRPPAVSRHRVSVEPGLSSPCRFPTARGGRPAVWSAPYIRSFSLRRNRPRHGGWLPSGRRCAGRSPGPFAPSRGRGGNGAGRPSRRPASLGCRSRSPPTPS